MPERSTTIGSTLGAPGRIRTSDQELRRLLLCPLSYEGTVARIIPMGIRANDLNRTITLGAGEGNRTLTTSLEGWGSTVELHPRNRAGVYATAQNTVKPVARERRDDRRLHRRGTRGRPKRGVNSATRLRVNHGCAAMHLGRGKPRPYATVHQSARINAGRNPCAIATSRLRQHWPTGACNGLVNPREPQPARPSVGQHEHGRVGGT